MRTELVSIETTTYPLDGAYYEPDEGPLLGAVLLMHGNTMNFYVGAPRFLPPVLTAMGLACLAFNRRGHDILSTRDSRRAEGGAFQKTAEAHEDNRLAGAWLEHRSGKHPIVIGHSNGGMLAVAHVVDHSETPALVLLSAHRGGREIVPLASKVGLLAGDRLEETTTAAEGLVSQGAGEELMLLQGWWYVASASSFLDYRNELPDVLELAPSVNCPTLYIRGDQEPVDLYPAEEFAATSAAVCDVHIIDDCEHFYVGREEAVARIVADWLERTLATAIDESRPRETNRMAR